MKHTFEKIVRINRLVESYKNNTSRLNITHSNDSASYQNFREIISAFQRIYKTCIYIDIFSVSPDVILSRHHAFVLFCFFANVGMTSDEYSRDLIKKMCSNCVSLQEKPVCSGIWQTTRSQSFGYVFEECACSRSDLIESLSKAYIFAHSFYFVFET